MVDVLFGEISYEQFCNPFETGLGYRPTKYTYTNKHSQTHTHSHTQNICYTNISQKRNSQKQLSVCQCENKILLFSYLKRRKWYLR